MTDDARARRGGAPPPPPRDEPSQEHESWLREAAHAPGATRLPRSGDVIGGKYRIDSLLGRGGMGMVFSARHVVSEKPVAIKWMLRSGAGEQARRRFEREARAAGRIEHPNVVSLFDIGEEGDCSYLVMELLRGESLRARVERGPLPATEAIDVLIPAMRGVAAAHRVGVVHRDLKPDNIFLCLDQDSCPSGAKVLDFGISSIAALEVNDSTLTQEGTLLGSLAYMSPEQLRSPHDVDGRTDVYAFGVILYELLSGQLPFQGASHSALIVAIATTTPKPLSEVQPNTPAGLEAVVRRALSRDAAERFDDVPSLIDALLPFGSVDRGSSAPRVSAPPGVRASRAREARAAMSFQAGLDPSTISGERSTGPGLRARLLEIAEPSATASLPRSRSRLVALGAACLLLIAVSWAMWGDMPEGVAPASMLPSPPQLTPLAPAAPPPAAVPARDAPPAAEPAVAAPSPANTMAKPAPEIRSRPTRMRTPAPRVDDSPPTDEKSLFSGRK